MYAYGKEDGDTDGDEREAPAKKEREVTPFCRRKVRMKSKTRLCGDPTGNSTCGACSRHCRDVRCDVHNR